MEWTKDQISSLKFDWPFYKQGKMTSEDLLKKYPGRNISSLSKKYWKLYGRLSIKKEERSEFIPAGGGLFGEDLFDVGTVRESNGEIDSENKPKGV